VPFLAALASLLFPGTGQAFTGRVRPAAIWAIAGLLPVFAVLLSPLMVWLAMAVRVAAAIDAYRQVRIARPGTTHLHLAGIWAVAQGTVLAVVEMVVVEAYVPQSTSMAPTLTLGDHVFIDKLTPRLAGYARGDVVVFDHPLGKKYLKRIGGVGGDHIAIRRGVLHVNGVAALRSPLGPATYWDHDDHEWRQQTVVEFEETLGDHRYRVYGDPPASPDQPWPHDFPIHRDDPDLDPCTLANVSSMPYGRAIYDQPPLRRTADGAACVIPAGTVFLLGDNRDNSNDSRYWGVVPVNRIDGRVIGIWWSNNPRTGLAWSRFGRTD
jgi:signal peptidase I